MIVSKMPRIRKKWYQVSEMLKDQVLTFIMLVLGGSRRPISILLRGFLLLGGEGAGEGAEEVEV
jgi:hypothetical protein